MSKAKQSSPRKEHQSFKQTPLKKMPFDPRLGYGVSVLVLMVVVFVFATQAIDSGSMWIFALLFVSIYFLANDTYRFMRAVKNQEQKIKPSGKRSKA